MRMLLQFQKGDIVRHLGLLDLQRTMQRALRRSGLPIRYSNGFNPHMVMNFASALSSGIPGDAELVDVSLTSEVTEEECLNAMNRVLPPSLAATRVRLVKDSYPKVSAALAQAEYRIHIVSRDARRIADAVEGFLSEEEIMAMRKTKRSETLVNIRPMLHELVILDAAQEEMTLRVRVSFVEAATLKPDLLVSTLCSYAKAEMTRCDIRRTGLYGVVNGQAVPLIDL